MVVLRYILIVVASVFMVGFGLCGVFGLYSAASSGEQILQYGVPFLVCGAIGVGLAVALFFFVRFLIRRLTP